MSLFLHRPLLAQSSDVVHVPKVSELSDSSKFRRPKDSLPAVDEIRAALRIAKKVVKVDCNIMALEIYLLCESAGMYFLSNSERAGL